jgi:hypothetical protein
MAWPKSVVLARQVRKDIETVLTRKPRQQQAALFHLLTCLLTAEPSQELEHLAGRSRGLGFKAHLRALVDHLRNTSRLPEALCARYEYGQSGSRVKHEWSITENEWRYVHDLGREVGMPLDVFYQNYDLTEFDWHEDLEEDIVCVDVSLDARAVEDLLLAVIEGYLSPRNNQQKGYEVYGVCLGMWRERANRKRRQGLRVARHVHILRCQPQLSADGAAYWVSWNQKSLDALMEATRSLFPSYDLVGDFHSHPYDTFPEMRRRKGWLLSKPDERDLVRWSQHMKGLGQRPSISLVAAVSRSDRAVQRSRYREKETTLQLSAGGCRVIIQAYRILGSGKASDRNLRLRAAGMLPG